MGERDELQSVEVISQHYSTWGVPAKSLPVLLNFFSQLFKKIGKIVLVFEKQEAI